MHRLQQFALPLVSRQIISHDHPGPQSFVDEFQGRVWGSRSYSSALDAAGLPHTVRAGAVRPIFESMVELAETRHSAHFPMYANAPALWPRITDFALRTAVEDARPQL